MLYISVGDKFGVLVTEFSTKNVNFLSFQTIRNGHENFVSKILLGYHPNDRFTYDNQLLAVFTSSVITQLITKSVLRLDN